MVYRSRSIIRMYALCCIQRRLLFDKAGSGAGCWYSIHKSKLPLNSLATAFAHILGCSGSRLTHALI